MAFNLEIHFIGPWFNLQSNLYFLFSCNRVEDKFSVLDSTSKSWIENSCGLFVSKLLRFICLRDSQGPLSTNCFNIIFSGLNRYYYFDQTDCRLWPNWLLSPYDINVYMNTLFDSDLYIYCSMWMWLKMFITNFRHPFYYYYLS